MKPYYKAVVLFVGLQLFGSAILYFNFENDKIKKCNYIDFKG